MKPSTTERTRFAASWIVFLAIGTACQTTPVRDPNGVRGTASLIETGTLRSDSLDCEAGDCEDWFRVRLSDAGKLTLEVRVMFSADRTATASIALEDGFGRMIDTVHPIAVGQRGALERALERGVYLIGISAPAGSSRVGYELEARFDRPPVRQRTELPVPEPEPEPRFTPVEAEVLEVEGRMASPDAVLLDLGERAGVRVGLIGELREDGLTVGSIEVVDVYPEGSRARVTGRLLRPLTPSVEALVLFPDNGQPDERTPEQHSP